MINISRFILIFLAVIACSSAAQAETSIGVVDVQAVLSQSTAGASIEKQITVYKDKFLDEVSKQEQNLRDTEKTLSAQRATMNKDEFAIKAKALEEKFVETGSMTQSRKRTLDKASNKALNTLRDKLYEIVQEIATEKKYNLVISKQNVIVGEQSIDLTQETMDRLNKALPDVKLDVNEAEADKE